LFANSKNMKIKKYILCAVNSAYDLSQEVNKYLDRGYELYGELSFAIAPTTGTRVFAQAVVLKGE